MFPPLFISLLPLLLLPLNCCSEVLVVNSHQGALLLLIHWFFCC